MFGGLDNTHAHARTHTNGFTASREWLLRHNATIKGTSFDRNCYAYKIVLLRFGRLLLLFMLTVVNRHQSVAVLNRETFTVRGTVKML